MAWGRGVGHAGHLPWLQRLASHGPSPGGAASCSDQLCLCGLKIAAQSLAADSQDHRGMMNELVRRTSTLHVAQRLLHIEALLPQGALLEARYQDWHAWRQRVQFASEPGTVVLELQRLVDALSPKAFLDNKPKKLINGVLMQLDAHVSVNDLDVAVQFLHDAVAWGRLVLASNHVGIGPQGMAPATTMDTLEDSMLGGGARLAAAAEAENLDGLQAAPAAPASSLAMEAAAGGSGRDEQGPFWQVEPPVYAWLVVEEVSAGRVALVKVAEAEAAQFEDAGQLVVRCSLSHIKRACSGLPASEPCGFQPRCPGYGNRFTVFLPSGAWPDSALNPEGQPHSGEGPRSIGDVSATGSRVAKRPPLDPPPPLRHSHKQQQQQQEQRGAGALNSGHPAGSCTAAAGSGSGLVTPQEQSPEHSLLEKRPLDDSARVHHSGKSGPRDGGSDTGSHDSAESPPGGTAAKRGGRGGGGKSAGAAARQLCEVQPPCRPGQPAQSRKAAAPDSLRVDRSMPQPLRRAPPADRRQLLGPAGVDASRPSPVGSWRDALRRILESTT